MPSADATDIAVVEIKPRPSSAWQSGKLLWDFRETVWAFGARHVRVKYKQTILGAAWVILQPLLFLVPFVIFFGRVARIDSGGGPYAAFALSALVPWQFISNAVTLASESLLAEADLIRKVYFPREAPLIGTIGAAGVDLVFTLPVGIVGALLLGGRIGPSVLLIPLLAAVLVIPVAAIALPLAAANVYYRDFRYVMPIAVQLWLFLSPVAIPIVRVPADWRLLYAFANPVAGPLDSFRRILVLGTTPDWGLLGASLTTAVVLLVVGYRIFKRFETQLADVI